jgi:hypothetical protein
MRCAKCRELISLAFDEDLSEGDRGRLVEHLTECADCRQHHAVLEQGRALLQEGLVEAPENLEWKVQLGIQRALRDSAAGVPQTRFGWGFWGRAAASATAMAAVVLFAGSYLLGPPTSPSSPGTPTDGQVMSQFAEGTQAADPTATPDLSGARPVTDFEVDAFGDGYGIRTVADQWSLGGVRENYPVAGRTANRERLSPYFGPRRTMTQSQVLHLRIVPTKLRTSSAASMARRASAELSAADSAAAQTQPRR